MKTLIEQIEIAEAQKAAEKERYRKFIRAVDEFLKPLDGYRNFRVMFSTGYGSEIANIYFEDRLGGHAHLGRVIVAPHQITCKTKSGTAIAEGNLHAEVCSDTDEQIRQALRKTLKPDLKRFITNLGEPANAEVSGVAVAGSTKTSGIRPPLSQD